MKKISYVIIIHDFAIPCDADNNQLDLWDALTLEECINLAADGIEIFLA